MPQEQPIQLELDAGGIYEIPTVQTVQGPAIFQGGLPVRLVLMLTGGTTVQVPIERLVLKELRDKLNKYLGDE